MVEDGQKDGCMIGPMPTLGARLKMREATTYRTVVKRKAKSKKQKAGYSAVKSKYPGHRYDGW